jgi:capsular polysaccharide transport system permease protein
MNPAHFMLASVGRAWGVLLRWHLFLVCVALPTSLAVAYYGFIASDVYVSQSLFVVRSPERQSTSPLGMLFKGAGFSRAQDDAYVVHDFMMSREALTALEAKMDIKQKFSDASIDPFSRFTGIDPDQSFEAFHRYFQKHAQQQIDSLSSITTLTIRAYTPQDAQRINQELLLLSEARVNQLNTRGRQDLINFAQQEVADAQRRALQASLVLADYRNKKGVIDPERQTAIPLQQIAKLQTELLAAKTLLAQVMLLARENPQIPSLKQTVAMLETEIALESAKVTGDTKQSLASKAADFQKLAMNKEFADKMLAGALTTLEQARSESQRQQLYLERIAQPSLPDAALEPRRIRGVLTAFVLGLLFWGIAAMVIAGVKEHQHAYRNLFTPYAELYHHESVSRGPNDTRAKRAVADAEAQFMRQKWGKLLDTDPYYNPNLTLVHEDFSLG